MILAGGLTSMSSCFIVTSHLSGRGNRIGLVFPSFHLSVSTLTDTKFGMEIDLDKISDKFDVQGYRSRSQG